MTRARRLAVSIPSAVDQEIKALAKRLATTDSKAALFLIMRGCEVMKAEKSPFYSDQDPDQGRI